MNKNRLLLRAATIIATVSLLLGMVSVNAGAANTALPDTTKKASLTIHKYLTDSENPATVMGDGTVNDEAHLPANVMPVENVNFEIVKVVENNKAAVEDVVYTDENGRKYIVDTDVSVKYDGQTDASGELVFGENGVGAASLPFGFYLVSEQVSDNAKTSQGNIDIATILQPFLVSVPLTDPDEGESWIYDVHVYPKNESLKIDKSAMAKGNKAGTVQIGETFKWLIDAMIPQNIAKAQSYVITDTLDTRLDYSNNLKVKAFYQWADKDTTDGLKEIPAAYVTLTADTDYTVEVPSADNANTLTVSLTKDGMAKLGTKYDHDSNAATDPVLPLILTVEFDSAVNDSVITDELLGTAIENGAELNFVSEHGSMTTPSTTVVDIEPEVHTGGLTIDKFDAAVNILKLEGAVFQIFATEEDAKAQTNPLTFYTTETDADTGVTTNVETTKATTDANGFAAIYGLQYGENLRDGKANTVNGDDSAAKASRAYYLVEIQAPLRQDGSGKRYNLLKEPIEVTINTDSHLADNVILVANNKGFQLPSAGGMGTVLFTIGGVVLMAGAVVLLLTTGKKKNKKKN